MTAHTPEPWRVDGPDVLGSGPVTPFIVDYNRTIAANIDRDEAVANARRIVACVNGCKGINPETVPDMRDALEWALRVLDHLDEHHYLVVVKMLDAQGRKRRGKANAALAKARVPTKEPGS